MEIDLLRTGKRVVQSPPLSTCSYAVLITRSNGRSWTEVWTAEINERLPTVPVPLLAGDRDVPLDLQAAFTSAYDDFDYDLTVEYSRPPEIPLSPEQAAWAKKQLGIPRATDSRPPSP